MKDLEADIVELEHLSVSTGNQGYIESLKVALADLLDSKVQGIKEMDPSNFFFSLEKKNRQGKVIHTLLSDMGLELMEPSQIRRWAGSFLFSIIFMSV